MQRWSVGLLGLIKRQSRAARRSCCAAATIPPSPITSPPSYATSTSILSSLLSRKPQIIRFYHTSLSLNAKKSKTFNADELLSFNRIEEDEGARRKREEKAKKPKSFNVALEFAGKADPIGPQPEGMDKWANFSYYILLPIFIGGVLLFFIHDYIVESAFGGDDTEIFEYMIGECFELAVANDQVMQKLGGQMSTDDTRVQFIAKDQGMRNIAVLPLYGTPGKIARCEVDLRTLLSGEIGIYSARVIFPGGEVIRLEAPTKRYGGRYWQDNIARDQEERAELERKQQQQQLQQARMQGAALR